MSIPTELKQILSSNPDVLGGTLCFAGTRVPIETFFDYIGTGYSVERFLQGFPSVTQEQALSILVWRTNQRVGE